MGVNIVTRIARNGQFLVTIAWIIIISLHFLFRDICINMAHELNRALKFDTFFILILSFGNGISNEWTSLPQKEKKSSHVWQILSQMTVIWYNHKVNNIQIILYRSSCSQMLYKIVGVHKGVLKNLTNFTGKHLCRV